MNSIPAQFLSPNVRIREHPRARRASIRVNPLGQVEVVVPKGFDRRLVAALLDHHRPWLQKTLQGVMALHGPAGEALSPRQITLPAVDSHWQVEYSSAVRRRIRETTDNRCRPLLQLATSDAADARQTLQRWLGRQARTHLLPWLQQVSKELELPFTKASVRGQKTRWGSCSSRGQISLNRNLLFLPPALVRYLFVHELCHTRHLNHSPRYWDLVGSLQPDYRDMETQLQQASVRVPLWAYPG